MTERFFATCPRGLEHVLMDELQALDAKELSKVDGGALFSGPLSLCYRVNLESRVASRVLWRVGHGRYRDEKDVYALAESLTWNRWFNVQQTLRVNVSAIKSPLKSLDFVTLRIKDAVCDVFRKATGRRPDVNTQNPDARIHAFLTTDEATLYLDTSGDPLFKRGYRQTTGEAPVRENLAAGILRLTGWTPDQPLLDPMCGSGTFLCEAALIAQDRAPGLDRRFGFERLHNFDRSAWSAVLKAAQTRVKPDAPLEIFGSDRYGDVLKLARANLENLEVADRVVLKQADVLEMPPPADHGVWVTNPPYGVRMNEQEELAAFYPKLGDALKKKYSGWTAYIFTGDLRLAKLIGLKASKRTPLFNGALECRLFEYKLVAGGMRDRPASAKPAE